MAKSQALQDIITALRSRPIPMDVSWADRRKAMEDWQAALAIPADVKTQPVDAGGVRAEWVWRPDSDLDRAILYLHGGGYAIGSIATHRYLMQSVSKASGARVLGIDYRLAPENPFPAAVEDAVAAWRWMLAQGLDPKRGAIAGDSAGGGLTLADADRAARPRRSRFRAPPRCSRRGPISPAPAPRSRPRRPRIRW